MTETKPVWTDQRLDQFLGNLLRIGVLSAAAVVLAGGILYLVRHGREPTPDYKDFDPQNPMVHYADSDTKSLDLRAVSGIIASAASGRSRGIIQLGVLLLIATPIARVIFSVVAFALQRDTLYVVVTLIVLGILLYSLFADY